MATDTQAAENVTLITENVKREWKCGPQFDDSIECEWYSRILALWAYLHNTEKCFTALLVIRPYYTLYIVVLIVVS
jgi:hypothetical protein